MATIPGTASSPDGGGGSAGAPSPAKAQGCCARGPPLGLSSSPTGISTRWPAPQTLTVTDPAASASAMNPCGTTARMNSAAARSSQSSPGDRRTHVIGRAVRPAAAGGQAALSRGAPICSNGAMADPATRPAVLVTGGAKRIGAAIARRFAEAGWHVVIHCNRSMTAAEALAGELPSAEAVRCDLADGGAALAMVEELAGRLDDWRALVNSASVFRPDDALQLDVGVN